MKNLATSTMIAVFLSGSACEPEGSEPRELDELRVLEEADPLHYGDAEAYKLEGNDALAIPEPPAPAEHELRFDDAAAAEGYAWTGWTSEENPPLTCGVNQAARGFDCSGSYCDNVRFDCINVPNGFSGSRTWTSFFSEESTNYRYCPSYYWVTGIACKGSYCDNIALECAYNGRNGSACRWSGWFSEEDPVFNAGSGRFIRGAQCNGSYCDNKRFYHCRM